MNKRRLIDFCQQATEFSLCAVVFFIPISIALVNIGIGFSFAFWTIKKFVTRDSQLVKTPVNLYLVCLIWVSLISFINTSNIDKSILGMEKLFKNIFLFFVFVETFNNKRSIMRIVWVTILSLSLVSIDGVYQYIMGKDFIRGNTMFPVFRDQFPGINTSRIGASMYNPNTFGVYLSSATLILLGLILYYMKGIKRFLFIPIVGLSFFCLINTLSRLSGMGFIFAISLFGIIKKDKRFIVAFIILLLILLIVLPQTSIAWMLTHFNPYDFFVEEGGRRLHWQAAINMIKAHPIIGVGTNTFSINYARYKIPGDPHTNWYAHNGYLHLAAEIGLVGLLLFIGMVGTLIRNWWISYKKIIAPELKAASLGVFGGFVSILVADIWGNSLQITNLAVLFWFIVGLITAINKVAAEQEYAS